MFSIDAKFLYDTVWYCTSTKIPYLIIWKVIFICKRFSDIVQVCPQWDCTERLCFVISLFLIITHERTKPFSIKKRQTVKHNDRRLTSYPWYFSSAIVFPIIANQGQIWGNIKLLVCSGVKRVFHLAVLFERTFKQKAYVIGWWCCQYMLSPSQIAFFSVRANKFAWWKTYNI